MYTSAVVHVSYSSLFLLSFFAACVSWILYMSSSFRVDVCILVPVEIHSTVSSSRYLMTRVIKIINIELLLRGFTNICSNCLCIYNLGYQYDQILPFLFQMFCGIHLQVWVLEEMQLPIVSISSELNSKKILLKSPWEILQKPAGSGAIFSLLLSNKILDTLDEMGVEFVQVRSCAVHLTFFHHTFDIHLFTFDCGDLFIMNGELLYNAQE